jgi:nucleoside-diphosphate-sugar epimerase
MKKILVTGAAGQIGSELVPALRERFGNENVVAAAYERPLPEHFRATGPSTRVDVTDRSQIDRALSEYGIDTLYHLSSILSSLAEAEPERANQVNISGVLNALNAAIDNGVEQVMLPSSMAAFGPETPTDGTPNDTVQRPNTLYGIAKVFGELMANYYQLKLGLDVRGVRLPGIISWKTEPTAGTTDYAVAIFYGAVRHNRYTCYLRPDTRLPMMYMPDAVSAMMDLAAADPSGLKHHSDFNVTSMSFTPAELADAIKARRPGFRVDYEVDPLRQAIADSWPNSMDDSAATQEWGWKPRYGLDSMVDDMLENLSRKLSGT